MDYDASSAAYRLPSIPSPIYAPSGCVIRARCPNATSTCAQTIPRLEEVSATSEVASTTSSDHCLACRFWNEQ